MSEPLFLCKEAVLAYHEQPVLATKCEELNINERRFDDSVPVVEAALLGMVPEELRVQFGL